MASDRIRLYITISACLISVAYSVTDPGDMKILNDFRNGLENPELLEWPDKGDDPCGPPRWAYVFCSNGRVTQIQAKYLGLKGSLPQSFNQLVKLQNLGLQNNNLSGALPSFSGLSELEYAYLDFNDFDTIPSDFFRGLSSIKTLALDRNPFNASTGWSIPDEAQELVHLTNFSCYDCNIVGPLPAFFGKMPSLTLLTLSSNRLSGHIPASFYQSVLQVLWLNDQAGGGMTGPIDVIGSMVGSAEVWLHGNQFSGTIPNNIGALTSLRELRLNRNQLVGVVPVGMDNLNLQLLDLSNNMLMGPIPKFKAATVTYASNSFCLPDPGEQCSPNVNAFLDFLGAVNFPPNLAFRWTGNDPCKEPWMGITCNTGSQVTRINLQSRKLNGTLSPSLANLDSLLEINLGGNNLSGLVPKNLTELKSLQLLDLSGNNFSPPLPKFRDDVKIIIDGNPQLDQAEPPSPLTGPLPPSPIILPSPPFPIITSPTLSPVPPSNYSTPGSGKSPIPNIPPSPSKGSGSNSPNSSHENSEHNKGDRVKPIVIVAATASSVSLVVLACLFSLYCFKKRKDTKNTLGAFVVHPRDSADRDNNIVKIAISDNTDEALPSGTNPVVQNTHVIEDGNMIISVQILRNVTDNFAPQNELGRGGFGAVYKGELEDGTKLAVKRMESGVISNKALDEFQAEIAVLSKVRHRHLVSLLGYSVEGNERLLVYEYMPQGALSMHLFRWKDLNLEPLSWARRLIIGLDVARGMEYLHSLAHQSFIHRDLKSSNILLGDNFRAKVSDFGLVKLAPDRERSVATKLAGTFGYLAPEYAVTGKITTKADVFSFGVVLMELLTGLMALDEDRSEESRYLAEWFWKIKSSKETLIAAIDPTFDSNKEIFESIYVIAELAGHCTARDPNHRPDMGHAVNVLAQLVEKWKPFDKETEDFSGIDYNLPLSDMLKGWKESENKTFSSTNLQDSTGSIPTRPAGFAESFTSSDAR